MHQTSSIIYNANSNISSYISPINIHFTIKRSTKSYQISDKITTQIVVTLMYITYMIKGMIFMYENEVLILLGSVQNLFCI